MPFIVMSFMSICDICHICLNHPQGNVLILSTVIPTPQVPTKNLALNQNLLTREITVPFFPSFFNNIHGFCVKFFRWTLPPKTKQKDYNIQVQGNVNTGWISPRRSRRLFQKTHDKCWQCTYTASFTLCIMYREVIFVVSSAQSVLKTEGQGT